MLAFDWDRRILDVLITAKKIAPGAKPWKPAKQVGTVKKLFNVVPIVGSMTLKVDVTAVAQSRTDSLERMEIWLWADDGSWEIGFARDPTNAAACHPLDHLQFKAKNGVRPPYLDWRIPLEAVNPVRIVEFVCACHM